MSVLNLSEDCLALILSWTSPADACRLACVCKAFASAAMSNIAWQNLLPSDYRDICQGLTLPPPAEQSARAAFRILSQDSIPLDHGKQRYRLLRKTGGVCRILSAAAMGIAWGDDTRFWQWERSKSSCFFKVAHLIAVCWLEVTGRWRITLPPGTYSVCWRLKVVNPQGGQVHFLNWKRPLRFFLSYSDFALEKELDLSQLPGNGFEKWFEFEVGQIELQGRGGKVCELNMVFGIQEIDCSFWKGGLFIDCLILRPSDCHDIICSNQPDRSLASVRGRPGVF